MEEIHDEKVAEINDLVKVAFGKRWRGNCLPSGSENGGVVGTLVHTGLNSLFSIAKRNFLPIPYLFESYSIAGRFESHNSARLSIFPEYLPQARVYAELHQERFGERVEISIIPEDN